ncbi:hypothetical protein RJZ90_002559, partial [Blastomyces dermatitidis]
PASRYRINSSVLKYISTESSCSKLKESGRSSSTQVHDEESIAPRICCRELPLVAGSMPGGSTSTSEGDRKPYHGDDEGSLFEPKGGIAVRRLKKWPADKRRSINERLDGIGFDLDGRSVVHKFELKSSKNVIMLAATVSMVQRWKRNRPTYAGEQSTFLCPREEVYHYTVRAGTTTVASACISTGLDRTRIPDFLPAWVYPRKIYGPPMRLETQVKACGGEYIAGKEKPCRLLAPSVGTTFALARTTAVVGIIEISKANSINLQ